MRRLRLCNTRPALVSAWGTTYRRRVRLLPVAVTATAMTAMLAAPAQAEGPGYKFFKSAGSPTKPGAYWDPCSTVRYGIDFTYARKQGLRVGREEDRWRSAVREVADAMGVRFVYEGRISSRAQNGVQPRTSAGVDLIITFGSESRRGRYGYGRVLNGPVAGIAGISWRQSSAGARVDYGYVIIDAKEVVRKTDAVREAFDPRPATQRPPDVVRSLYMHEFGHAVGLAHVRDKKQLMYPRLLPERSDTLGRGDLRGLRKLGNQRCF